MKRSSVKAVILAGGLGKRLGLGPKAMVCLGGKHFWNAQWRPWPLRGLPPWSLSSLGDAPRWVPPVMFFSTRKWSKAPLAPSAWPFSISPLFPGAFW